MKAFRRTSWLAALLASIGLLASAPAQARTDVCYQGGVNLPNFKLNGSALLDGVDLLVTPDLGTQLASAMFIPPFAATSDIHIQIKLKITTNTGAGADGMTFVMHRDPRGPSAIGDAGGGIGYGGVSKITPSVVVEMDTYQNVADINANHIGIMIDGNESDHKATFTPPFQMRSVGTPFNVWIDYTATIKTLTVYISQTDTKPTVPDLLYVVDVAAKFENMPFYMGFTGSTGGQQSKHEILSFVASDTALTSAVCCTTNTDCTGSTLGPICDPIKHVCGQCSTDDLSSCAPDSGCDIGSANNTCTPACTGNFASEAESPCPTAAAPYCIPAGPRAGSCVTCNGNFGSGAQYACPKGAPSCNASGSCGLCTANTDCAVKCDTASGQCMPCDGDFGSAAAVACPEAKNPLCDATGGCRACTNNNDCTTGPHAGPFCNTTSGACVTGCAKDAECATTEWCDRVGEAAGVCTPKLDNSTPLPAVVGACTTETGTRVCKSGLCSDRDTCVECSGQGGCTGDKVCSSDNVCQSPPVGRLAGGGFGCSTVPGGATGAGGLTFLAFALLLSLRRRQSAAARA